MPGSLNNLHAFKRAHSVLPWHCSWTAVASIPYMLNNASHLNSSASESVFPLLFFPKAVTENFGFDINGWNIAFFMSSGTYLKMQRYIPLQKKNQSKAKTPKPTPLMEIVPFVSGVLLHVMGDALGSVVVVVTATIFYVRPLGAASCNWQCYIDPSLTIVMVFIILSSAFPLIKETSTILLQMVPKGVNMQLLSKSNLLLKCC